MDKKIAKKNWPPKKIITVSAASLFVAVVVYSFVFGDQSSKLNVERERITISEVNYGPFQEFIPITGTVQPIATFFLDVSEGGRVTTKYVEEGAMLEIGDPIIKLENPNLTMTVMYNEAQLFQQMNALRTTRLQMEQNKLNLMTQNLSLRNQMFKQKRIYERDTKLYEKNLISEFEFQESKEQFEYLQQSLELTRETQRTDSLFRENQVAQLQVSISRMEENLAVTKHQLDNLTIKAPIKGQLTSLDAEIGQSIGAGQNLGRIDAVDNYKVRAAIDEHYIARVSNGQAGEFTFSGSNYHLNIQTVYPEVSNGRFEVDMLFAGEPPVGIRRGQTLHIKLELGELSEAVLVDRGGFYQTTGGQWIFVLDASESFAVRRPIRLGRQNPQVFEVLEGLEKGERVITSSYDNYGDIEKLVIKD
ncbi:MAG: HlyD family efflux transporter periplasmic adaptor subunit [Bacteroidetes bacterium]|nr:HlyD family efflux transporter periplasmic adaptor subunit [Bacteroidota bacterium]